MLLKRLVFLGRRGRQFYDLHGIRRVFLCLKGGVLHLVRVRTASGFDDGLSVHEDKVRVILLGFLAVLLGLLRPHFDFRLRQTGPRLALYLLLRLNSKTS